MKKTGIARSPMGLPRRFVAWIILLLLGTAKAVMRRAIIRAARLECWARSAKKAEVSSCRDSLRIQLTKGACHFSQLFVKHDGGVYPCCLTLAQPDLRIGHVADPRLLDRLRDFSASCRCERYILRKASQSDELHVNRLNIELSLACQGECAMCRVGAPAWSGTFDHYDALTWLVETLRPRVIFVQGGEVLVQPQSLKWIERIKAGHDTHMSIATNGCFGIGKTDLVERLWEAFLTRTKLQKNVCSFLQ